MLLLTTTYLTVLVLELKGCGPAGHVHVYVYVYVYVCRRHVVSCACAVDIHVMGDQIARARERTSTVDDHLPNMHLDSMVKVRPVHGERECRCL